MKLIKPSTEILTPIDGITILKTIEQVSRTCYLSEPNITEDSYKTFITKLIKRGHHAMLEFGGMITVRFIVDRGVSHELVRHRVASFAQESTRYCNYGKDEHITFIIPNYFKSQEEQIISGLVPFEGMKGNTEDANEYLWKHSCSICEVNYNALLRNGWTPQQARSVLPNSLKTEINVSANIREWRHIFKLRIAKAAHPQMREVMIPLLAEFKQLIPIIFDDII